MEIIFIIIIGALVLGAFSKLGAGSSGTDGAGFGANDDVRVENAVRKYGVTLSGSYTLGSSGSGDDYRNQTRRYAFSGTDKAGIDVTGEVSLFGVGGATVTFDSSGAGARAARAQGRLLDEESADPSELDPEEQIRREISRRLDALQGDRDAFLRNDTDGDGMVDDEEWAKARAQLEADVRAELEVSARNSEPEPAPASPVASDEGW